MCVSLPQFPGTFLTLLVVHDAKYCCYDSYDHSKQQNEENLTEINSKLVFQFTGGMCKAFTFIFDIPGLTSSALGRGASNSNASGTIFMRFKAFCCCNKNEKLNNFHFTSVRRPDDEPYICWRCLIKAKSINVVIVRQITGGGGCTEIVASW